MSQPIMSTNKQGRMNRVDEESAAAAIVPRQMEEGKNKPFITGQPLCKWHWLSEYMQVDQINQFAS